jgi:hypothetical protein
MGENPPTKPSWQEIVAKKRAIRDAAVDKYLQKWEGDRSPWPSAEERAITGIGELAVLQERIGKGELRAEEVVGAYIRR